MTTELRQAIQPVAPEEADRMITSLPDSLHSHIQSQSQAVEVENVSRRLSIPATRQWIAGRVATILSQYFTSSVPPEMMQAIAADWHEELAEYPAWAINRACRWWMSAGNENRRRKPLPGDIGERAKKEMAVVRLARRSVDNFNAGRKPTAPSTGLRPVESAEQRKANAAEIMAQAGFAPKRFGGE